MQTSARLCAPSCLLVLPLIRPGRNEVGLLKGPWYRIDPLHHRSAGKFSYLNVFEACTDRSRE